MPRKSCMFVLLAYCLLLGSLKSLEAAENTCKIVISTKDFTTSVFYPQDGQYQKAYSIEGRDYSISPNQEYLVIETPSNRSDFPDGKQVVFYDLTTQQPQRLDIALDVGIIRGSAWSHDSTKLLMQDAYNNSLLYLYDLKSKSLQFIARSFDPILEVTQVTWSPNNKFIAFTATESQIPRPKVVTLYTLEIDTLKYHPLSSVTENVGYYFDDFYWIGNDSVAFTRCSVSNNEQCGIKQTTIDGRIVVEFEGKYSLTGYDGNNQLEVLDQSQQGSDAKGTVDLSILDLNSKSFTFIQRFPVDQITPYPIFSLLNDRQRLVYMNEMGQTVLKNLKTSTTTVINQTSDLRIAQFWSIDGNLMLFPTKSGFYIYDMKSGNSHLAFNYSDMNNISSYNLLCGEKST